MQNFVKALGTFWTHLFEDKDILQDMATAYELSLSNAYFNFLELILGESIHDIPVFNKKLWYQLYIRQEDDGVNAGNSVRYGDGKYSYGSGLTYGGRIPGYEFSVAVDSSIVDVSDFICNAIYNPSVVLVKGKDFIFDDGAIHFVENPLGSKPAASFWIPLVKFDQEHLWRTYGAYTGIYKEYSSEQYKLILRAAFALFFYGPRKRFLMGYLNAVYNLPIIQETQETVTSISDDGLKIVTDRHIYDIDNPLLPLIDISVGQVLKQFEPLTTVIDYIDNETNPNWWQSGEYFSFPQRFLSGEYQGSLKIYKQHVVYRNQLGYHMPIRVSGRMSAAMEKRFKNFPLQLGMPIKLGESVTCVDMLDFFVGPVSDQLFVINIDPTLADITGDNTAYWNIFDRVIPAHIGYIVRYTIETLSDQYDIADVDDSHDFPDGITPWERTRLNIDIRDGFWGVHDNSMSLGTVPYLEERDI
jgi:hypothetical protein